MDEIQLSCDWLTFDVISLKLSGHFQGPILCSISVFCVWPPAPPEQGLTLIKSYMCLLLRRFPVFFASLKKHCFLNSTPSLLRATTPAPPLWLAWVLWSTVNKTASAELRLRGGPSVFRAFRVPGLIFYFIHFLHWPVVFINTFKSGSE